MDDVSYERVQVPTANPFVLTDYGQTHTTTPMAAEFYTPATLPPPYPAVVVSEGLGGVKNARERRYGRFLAQHGYAALVVDSFKTRGFENAAHPIRAINVTESMMLADAFAGLRWLAERPDIDAGRISNIGFSYGGMICVLTAYEQLRRLFVPTHDKFAAHVSYYGPTVPRLEDYATTGAPVAILNGELDNNFHPKRLDMIAQDLKNGGSEVENIVFPDTYHQWDSDDVVRRFDRFNIRDLGTWIDPEQTIIDEKSGRKITNFATRLMMIAGSVSLKGFHLLRDEAVMRKTDEILLRTIAAGGAQDSGTLDPPARCA
ncbi:dienelactone hydrolase family protein [Acuticoccus sp. I52.16.1]|uniref:dienelactone hydrolase family protein n=1 Tax=Acuticoccus sp. I52.16.1 TaxID=2928472 RepID=UPI001FD25D8F|nr:dienelactone hydrolase family protein [Acuticoccus sp. I52.16.1]UOM33229.1 dienelactone hydrolase family protein [Acuticoccus sp. I52.16.1]